MPVNEKIEDDTKHRERFGKTLGAAVETSEIITNAAVGTLNEMSLRFGHRVWLRNLHAPESDMVTTVSVRVYVSNIRSQPLDCTIYRHRRFEPPANHKRNNTLFPS